MRLSGLKSAVSFYLARRWQVSLNVPSPRGGGDGTTHNLRVGVALGSGGLLAGNEKHDTLVAVRKDSGPYDVLAIVNADSIDDA